MCIVAGTDMFTDFETETISEPPKSLAEQLDACRHQLRNVHEKLRAANTKIQGLYFEYVYILLQHKIFQSWRT